MLRIYFKYTLKYQEGHLKIFVDPALLYCSLFTIIASLEKYVKQITGESNGSKVTPPLWPYIGGAGTQIFYRELLLLESLREIRNPVISPIIANTINASLSGISGTKRKFIMV